MTAQYEGLRAGQLFRDALPGRSDIRTVRIEAFGTPWTDTKGRTRCAVYCTVVAKTAADGAVTAPMRTLKIDATRLTSEVFEPVQETEGADVPTAVTR